MPQVDTSVQDAVADAMQAASVAAAQFLSTHGDGGSCGFAWTTTYEKGSTKLGRALLKSGFRKAYGGGLQLWNPSKSGAQSISALEAGADAAATLLTARLGVKFYSGSRMD